MQEAEEREKAAAQELFKAKQQEKTSKDVDSTKDKDEKTLIM